MQLGPLAELLVAGDPLTTDLAADHGVNAYLRQLVRWTRGAAALILMRGWLDELEGALGDPLLEPLNPADIDHDSDGIRRHQRHSRHADALGHPARRPDHHVSGDHANHLEREPSRLAGRPGHFEQSLVGLPADEPGRAVRALVLGSHDPCLVCTTQ